MPIGSLRSGIWEGYHTVSPIGASNETFHSRSAHIVVQEVLQQGYGHKLMMAGPFVSKHLLPDSVRFLHLFSKFCDHSVSMIRPNIPVSTDANTAFEAQPNIVRASYLPLTDPAARSLPTVWAPPTQAEAGDLPTRNIHRVRALAAFSARSSVWTIRGHTAQCLRARRGCRPHLSSLTDG